jgi:hypothetical protein
MKFILKVPCDCGGRFLCFACGDADFGCTQCSEFRKAAHVTDPLSVSVTAERLLHGSKPEFVSGDFETKLENTG